jgi:hypothetical protein
MTSLFALIFLGTVSTAEARPHHTSPTPKHHVAHVKPRQSKPKPKSAHVHAHAYTYHYSGYRYYHGAVFVWQWVPGHWHRHAWVRAHWEISYRI